MQASGGSTDPFSTQSSESSAPSTTDFASQIKLKAKKRAERRASPLNLDVNGPPTSFASMISKAAATVTTPVAQSIPSPSVTSSAFHPNVASASAPLVVEATMNETKSANGKISSQKAPLTDLLNGATTVGTATPPAPIPMTPESDSATTVTESTKLNAPDLLIDTYSAMVGPAPETGLSPKSHSDPAVRMGASSMKSKDAAVSSLPDRSVKSESPDVAVQSAATIISDLGSNPMIPDGTSLSQAQAAPDSTRAQAQTMDLPAAKNDSKGRNGVMVNEQPPPPPILNSSPTNDASVISAMQAKLDEANATIAELQARRLSSESTGSDSVSEALQSELQTEMALKAEAENRARLAELKVQQLEASNTEQTLELEKFASLQSNLEQQMTYKAEAEHKARSAYDRVQQLESEKEHNVDHMKQLQKQLEVLCGEKNRRETELVKMREERNEQDRKIMTMMTRLNSAKKKEAVKVNMAEDFADDLKQVHDELDSTKTELTKTTSAMAFLEKQLDFTKKSLTERVQHLENALKDEKSLGEERKSKMKEFVEKKAEEIRQTKEDNDSLQLELTQTNRSHVDLNNRWKQMHTQYVQAQTRNRELQRDLNRIKKDSENLHRQGDSLEMKLSRSANETEEHKNKRLAAKHELMSVLSALESERSITTALRDKIKFVVAPQVSSQQQMLSESCDEFEAALQMLALRLGKPLPPRSLTEEPDNGQHQTTNGKSSALPSFPDNSHADTNALLEKLEHDSGLVTGSISLVESHLERLRALVDASGDRTCFTVFSELVKTGQMRSPALVEEGRAIAGQLARRGGQSHQYGQITGETNQLT